MRKLGWVTSFIRCELNPQKTCSLNGTGEYCPVGCPNMDHHDCPNMDLQIPLVVHVQFGGSMPCYYCPGTCTLPACLFLWSVRFRLHVAQNVFNLISVSGELIYRWWQKYTSRFVFIIKWCKFRALVWKNVWCYLGSLMQTFYFCTQSSGSLNLLVCLKNLAFFLYSYCYRCYVF